MNNLILYGLDTFFTKQLSYAQNIDNLARIISVSKNTFKIVTNKDSKEKIAHIKGSLMHYQYSVKSLMPKVGDFVVIQNDIEAKQNDNFFISKVLERKSEFKRKVVGRNEEQIIATNIDYILITISADEQFNLKKLDRMVAACFDSNITPIIIITKSDLSKNIMEQEKSISLRFPDITVIVTSFLQAQSVEPIFNLLKNNKTAIFVGSSGAGKSTLTNLLLKKETQKTFTVSEEQSKGQHTTTSREMFTLESGGCIIDNPGIREFGLWLEDSLSINKIFKDIYELSLKCKFADCTHTTEPNCAVKEAVEKGMLDKERLEEYLKLKQEDKELEALKTKFNKIKEGQRKQKKNLAKMYKESKQAKKITKTFYFD